MDKQKEIEKMAADLDKAKELALGTVGSLNNGFGGWYAKCLVEKGYGDVRAAVKEFVENIIQKQFSAKLGIGWSAVIKVNDIEQIAKEYGIELFGNTEQMEDKE